MALAPTRVRPRSRPAIRRTSVASRYPRMRRVFLAILVVQGVHTGEHVVQVVQRVAFHEPNPQGLIGAALAFEWVHLAFNLTIGMLLLVVFFGYDLGAPEWRALHPAGWWGL